MHNLFQDIKLIADEALKHQPYFYIAIDGPSCSGKTHLANKLKHFLDASVISMDDFFLQLPQRSEERYAEIGGNVDYERFISEILEHKDDEEYEHYIYDCHTFGLQGPKIIHKQPIVIIEGSYSMHPKFQNPFDLNILLEVSKELQLERLKERNPENYDTFINRWIPLEEKYFAACDLKAIADIVIKSE